MCVVARYHRLRVGVDDAQKSAEVIASDDDDDDE
jgi:hypothetical protein